MAASPIKGLERLSEELRLERQKSNQALQERARSKIEIESLRQTNEHSRNELLDLQSNYEELKSQNVAYRTQLEQFQNQEYLYQQKIDSLEQHLREFQLHHEQFVAEQHQLKLTYQKQHEDVLAYQIKIDTLEKKSLSKDDLINSLKQDIANMRNAHLSFEQEKLSTIHELSNKTMLNEELQLQLQSVNELNESYEYLQQRNQTLKLELDESMELNSQLNSTIHELTNKLLDKQQSEKNLSFQLETIQQEKHHLVEDITQLESQYSEILQHIKLEKDAHVAMRERANAAVRNRTFLDEQVFEIKSLYEETLQKNNDYEVTIHDLQLQTIKLQEKNQELTNLLDDKDHQIQKFSQQTSYQQDIGQLKMQLAAMKKQLLQQQLQQETSNDSYATHSILQREQQAKQVYDTIIQDLRNEQLHLSNKYEELLLKYNQNIGKAQRVEQLEEEIQMYQDMAKHITLEKQTVELTASEVSERNLKTIHENHHLLTNLHRVEKELFSSQSECQQQSDEIHSLREKNKSFHQQQLAAEKKATELLTLNAKLQGSLEDMKQQYDILQMDYEKVLRQLHDQSATLTDHSKLHHDLTNQKQVCEQLQNQYSQQTLQLTDLQHIQQKEQEMFLYQKNILTQEIENCKQKLNSKESSIRDLHQEITQLHHEYHQQILQQEKLIKHLQTEDGFKTEQQLMTLKLDLQQTLQDFQEMEQEKQLKSTIITNMQLELTKEKEYNGQLVYQVTQLEEKTNKLLEELNSYRSVDIYHHTKQVELASYRNQHKSNSLKTSGKLSTALNNPVPPPPSQSDDHADAPPPLPTEEYTFDDDDDHDDDNRPNENRAESGDRRKQNPNNSKLSIEDIVGNKTAGSHYGKEYNFSMTDSEDGQSVIYEANNGTSSTTFNATSSSNPNRNSLNVYRPLFSPATSSNGNSNLSSSFTRAPSSNTVTTTTGSKVLRSPTTDYTNRIANMQRQNQDYHAHPNRVMLSDMMKPYANSSAHPQNTMASTNKSGGKSDVRVANSPQSNKGSNYLHGNSTSLNSSTSTASVKNRLHIPPELMRAEEEDIIGTNTIQSVENQLRKSTLSLQELQNSKRNQQPSESYTSTAVHHEIKPSKSFEYRGDLVNRALKEQAMEQIHLQQQLEEDPAYQRQMRRSARDKMLLERVLLEEKLKSSVNNSSLSSNKMNQQLGSSTSGNENSALLSLSATRAALRSQGSSNGNDLGTKVQSTSNGNNLSSMSFSALRSAEQHLMKKTGVDLEKAKRLLSM